MMLISRQIFISLQTILNKEITRFMRIWTQTLLPPAITMTLYFIIFGKLIGSQIQSIGGFTYMQYIVPGLVMMAMMTNAYANTSSSFFGSKFTKSIEEIVVAPVPSFIILMGFVFGGMVRGLLVGLIVTIISLFFTHLHLHHIGIVIVMSLMSCMLFSVCGLINAIFAKTFDDIAFIPTFVLTPLTYLGGVFYSIQQLPPFWRSISVLNPILNIVDTFRFGILGISDVNVYFGMSLVFVLLLAFMAWAWVLLERGTGIRH